MLVIYKTEIANSLELLIAESNYYHLKADDLRAKDILKRYYKKDSTALDLLLVLSELELSTKQYDSAIYYADKGLKSDSSIIAFYKIKAEAYSNKFWYATAINLYQKALTLEPEDSIVLRKVRILKQQQQEYLRKKKKLEISE